MVRAHRCAVMLGLDLRDNLQALLFYTGTYEPALSRFSAFEPRRPIRRRSGPEQRETDSTSPSSRMPSATPRAEMDLFVDDSYDPADAGMRSAFDTGPARHCVVCEGYP